MREKIDLPLNLSTWETLASPDRLIFSIFTHNEREGEISLFRSMDNFHLTQVHKQPTS